MQAMKLDWAEVTDAARFISDPEWVLEQKFDGTRAIAVVTTAGVSWPKDDGGQLSHSAATQHCRKINPALLGLVREGDRLVLDGEIIVATGEYHVWDVLEATVGGEVLVTGRTPLHLRRLVVDFLPRWASKGLGPIRLVRQAVTEPEKAALWAEIQSQGAEGAVAKLRTSLYRPGTRSREWIKLKLVKTADLVVLGRTAKPNAIQLGAYSPDGELVEVGACSGIGKAPVAVGGVIEVNYLYWTGSRVYQPRMMRVREDKTASACSTDQFRSYSRAAI
jgi:ATP-dependent DNA ligase